MLTYGLFVVLPVNALNDIDLKMRLGSSIEAHVECAKRDNCMAYGNNVVTFLQDKMSPKGRFKEA
jgi:hypothetical protein